MFQNIPGLPDVILISKKEGVEEEMEQLSM